MSDTLSKAEGLLLIDALNGVALGFCPRNKLGMHLFKALEKREVQHDGRADREEFQRKIREEMTRVAAEELIEAAERFRSEPVEKPVSERVRDSGLTSVVLRGETTPEEAPRDSTFTEAEALLLAEAFNGFTRGADARIDLLLSLDDGIKVAGLDKKWGVDGEGLLHRLRKVTPVVAERLLEAIGFGPYWPIKRNLNVSDEAPSARLRSVVLHEETCLHKASRVPEPFNLYNEFDLLLAKGELTPELATKYLVSRDKKLRDYARTRLDRVNGSPFGAA